MSFNITVEGGTSVRLPTAGKYCDRDIIVTAEGGGVELDVVTASSLPATVTDGQIVVITDTIPEAVYIDTDEPANPVTGDVWVKLEAEATVQLELSEESPYLRGGLTGASQWEGSEWVSRDGYLGVDGEWVQIALSLPPVGTALNDCTWEQISKIAASGKAKDYFVVGDAKEIVINGNVGNTVFDNLSIWAFVIGFDHNADIEGGNTIHFQIGKSAQTNGTNLSLVDGAYNTSIDSAGYFSMNTTYTNTGGWENSYMRTVLLSNNSTPLVQSAGSLMAALPRDLRAMMKAVTKYSDNTGGGTNKAANVTATTDYLWLLSEYEVFGIISHANSTEQNYQKQYAYYASGNSKIFARHTGAGAANWWLRSLKVSGPGAFGRVNSLGEVNFLSANYTACLAPAFCI